MPVWTLFGLRRGVATDSTSHGAHTEAQEGVLGFPRLSSEQCHEGCRACAEVCLPKAISLNKTESGERLDVDYGRCIGCQLCVESCPNNAMQPTHDWAFGVRSREDLVWAEALSSPKAHEVTQEIQKYFGRSLHVRHVDAGSCNGCESELQALNNPYYNLHRLGIFFTPSPRFADLLLVTGPITYAMHDALLATYNAMPQPRWVMAMGTCAVSGGVTGGGYSCGNGLESVLPVDLYVPGCPPNPSAMIHALLLLLRRAEQHVHGGRYAQ